MKYLKDKNSRRRGVAIELAIGMLLIMVAISTIIVTTTMIQIEKQKNSVNDLKDLITDIEKMEYDQVGLYFEELVQDEISIINSEPTVNTTRKTLFHLSHLYLTEDSGSIEITENEVEAFQKEIIDSIGSKLNEKFATLVIDRNINFEVTIEYTDPIVLQNVENEDRKFLLQREENGDVVTITKTMVFAYNISFSLAIYIDIEETSYNVFSVENNIILNSTASLMTTYLKQFELVPIDKEITYTFNQENIVELYLKEGHYISFKGKEGIKLEQLSTSDDDSIVNHFTIQQVNSQEDINNQTDENICMITANPIVEQDDFEPVTITIILNYKKKIEAVVIDEEPGEDKNEDPQYEGETLTLKITKVKEYPIEEEDKGDESDDPSTQPEQPVNNNLIEIEEVPNEENQEPGSNDSDSEGDFPENVETPKPNDDIIIKRQTGVEKKYTGEEIEQEASYNYEPSELDLDEALVRTLWEYK